MAEEAPAAQLATVTAALGTRGGSPGPDEYNPVSAN